MKKGNNAAVCIAQQTEKSDSIAERLKPYKCKVKPHAFCFEDFEKTLLDHFDCEDITRLETARNRRHHRIFRLNYEQNPFFKIDGCFQPVFYRIVRNEKSEKLFEELYADQEITVYIEKTSGYFETNSNRLYRKLCIARGVTQKDYDSNSVKLLDLLAMMKEDEME